MANRLEKEELTFNANAFATSPLALESSTSNSAVTPDLRVPVDLSLSRASSAPGSTGATYELGTLPSYPPYPPIQRNNESVTPSAPTDVFRFRITGTRSINLNLHNISWRDDADLYLYRDSNSNGLLDATDALIQRPYLGGNADEAINVRARAGTYFAKVERYPWGSSGNVYYDLHLSATPTSGGTSQRASNLLPLETNIGTLNGTKTFSGSIGNTNTSEIYYFRLGSNSNFNLTLTGLSKDADVRLIKDVNGNRIIDSGDVFNSSIQGSNNSEWISRYLGAGNYFVQVYQYSNNTNYNLSVSTGDWYSQHLSDPGIIGLARQFARDGQLSRNETIAILRDTKDYGSVSTTELRDLRTLVVGLPDAPRPVSMPRHVYNLSYKVVNLYDPNIRSGIGNLVGNDPVTRMENLIGKHFYGTYRPAAASGTVYRYASGSLFRTQPGTSTPVSHLDINQGNLGDCYFLAALAGTAFRSPSTISDPTNGMFIDNGDNTYTVRFYNNGVADYVTVDRYLPVNENTGRFVYANRDRDGGLHYNDSRNELWVALAEKAYAQMNEAGWTGHGTANSYAAISGGWPDTAVEHITARNTVRDLSLTNSDRTAVINAFNAGRIVFLNWASHALTLVGYNSTTQRFTIHNPWGNHYELSWQQILNGGNGSERYTDWSYTTT